MQYLYQWRIWQRTEHQAGTNFNALTASKISADGNGIFLSSILVAVSTRSAPRVRALLLAPANISYRAGQPTILKYNYPRDRRQSRPTRASRPDRNNHDLQDPQTTYERRIDTYV